MIKVCFLFSGFCVKSKELSTDCKIFVNICKTEDIPPPTRELSENELCGILNMDDISDYKVPMSIGNMRMENDKKGEEAKVCDIAINAKFYDTVAENAVFKRFV